MLSIHQIPPNMSTSTELELAPENSKTLNKHLSRMELEQLVATFINAAGPGNNLEKLKECVKLGVYVESHVSKGFRAIHIASYFGHLLIIKYLVDSCHIAINAKSNDGWTALHLAAQHGHLDTVQYLVHDCNAEVTTKDADGYTALHLASGKGHLAIVVFLIEDCHVDIAMKSYDGWTALNCASRNGHLDVVQYIMQK